MTQSNQPWISRIFGTASAFLMPILVLGVGVVLFSGLMALREAPPESAQDDSLPLVSVVHAEAYSGQIEIVASGLVVPFREIMMSTQVDGNIVMKSENCQAGRFVQKDELLLEIDSANYLIEVDRLSANLRQAEAQVAEVVTQIENATNAASRSDAELAIRIREKARIEAVSNPDVFSQRDWDEAEWNFLKATDALESAREQIRLLEAQKTRLEEGSKLVEAQLRRAELDLARCQIVAPTDGIITLEMVEQGGYVNRATTLLQFEDTSKVEVECNLRVAELQQILENAPEPLDAFELPNNRVIVEFDTGAGVARWEGVLSRYNGVGIDQTTRTVPCVIEVDSPTNDEVRGFNTLVRGMYVTVRVQIDPTEPLVAIPAVAMQSRNTVWVVNEQSALQRVECEEVRPSTEFESSLVSEDGKDWILIKSISGQLQANSQVVVSPISYSTEDQSVDVELSAAKPPKMAADDLENDSSLSEVNARTGVNQ